MPQDMELVVDDPRMRGPFLRYVAERLPHVHYGKLDGLATIFAHGVEEQLQVFFLWLGHASFGITGNGKTVYIDPFQIKGGSPKADIILITHDHFDHNSPEDIAKIAKSSTVIVAPADAAKKHKGNVKVIEPGQSIAVDGRRIYHSGDTDAIPEMGALKVDVALVPVGGTYTMTAEDAAKAVGGFMPKVAVPMHYNSIVGTAAAAERFKAACKAPVEILKQE